LTQQLKRKSTFLYLLLLSDKITLVGVKISVLAK